MIETKRLQSDIENLERAHRALVIANQEDFEEASVFLRDVKALRAEIANTFDDAIKSAHDAHKSVIAAKKRHDDPLVRVEIAVKALMGKYVEAQAAERRAEAARLEAEAIRAEQDRRLEEAAVWEASGDSETAARVLDEPGPVIVALPTVEAPRAAGVSTQEKWTADVVDLMALVRAIAAGAAPVSLVAPDQSVLNKMAAALKGELRFPGVKVVRSTIVSARRSA